jgi:hypothetical protein
MLQTLGKVSFSTIAYPRSKVYPNITFRLAAQYVARTVTLGVQKTTH